MRPAARAIHVWMEIVSEILRVFIVIDPTKAASVLGAVRSTDVNARSRPLNDKAT